MDTKQCIIYTMKLMTEEQEKWFVNNYPLLGAHKCAKRLGLAYGKVSRKAAKMRLKLNPEILQQKRSQAWGESCQRNRLKYERNPIPMNARVAYTLGLVWADGCVRKKSRWRHEVSLSMVKKDAREVFNNLATELGRWSIYDIAPQNERAQRQWKAILTGIMYHLFVDTDYPIKSGGSQNKILDKIPESLRHYFWLGYVDGDGCWYVGRTANQFSLTSVFDQDWKPTEAMFNKLGIQKYGIQREVMKNGRHSKIRIANRKDLLLLIDYLYQGYSLNKIGLKRKYKKAMLIRNRAIIKSI